MTSKDLPLPRRIAPLSGGVRRALTALRGRRAGRADAASDRATALRERLDHMEAARTAAERARLWW